MKAYPVSSPSGPSVAHHFDRIKDDLTKEGTDFLIQSFSEKLEKQIEKR